MKKLVWLLATPLLASPLWAADLLQIYREAQRQRRDLRGRPGQPGSRARERTPQARAGLLADLVADRQFAWNQNESDSRNTSNTTPANFNSNGYTLTLTQPLFRWQNWVAYDQSKFQVAQAEANFVQAGQDLILRVAQAYFDVLYASESLKAVRPTRNRSSSSSNRPRRNFEVGTSTIVDSQEAQARFDLATAQEIAAESDLEVRQRTLQAIIGKEPGPLAPFRRGAEISPPQPADMKQWAAAAEKDNISVQIQMAAVEIATREVDRQRAGHYPTVDLVANKGTLGRSGDRRRPARNQFPECRRPAQPADFPGRRGCLPPERSERQSCGGRIDPRAGPAQRSPAGTSAIPRRHQWAGTGTRTQGRPDFVAIVAGIQPAGLRSRRAHQHRRAECRQPGLRHPPRPGQGGSRHADVATQAEGRCRHLERGRRGGRQRTARPRGYSAIAARITATVRSVAPRCAAAKRKAAVRISASSPAFPNA